jgi:hypothetical protein
MIQDIGFMGNKKISAVVPAACLSLLTIGSVSVYGIPGDISMPALFLIAICTLIMVVVFLRVNTDHSP